MNDEPNYCIEQTSSCLQLLNSQYEFWDWVGLIYVGLIAIGVL